MITQTKMNFLNIFVVILPNPALLTYICCLKYIGMRIEWPLTSKQRTHHQKSRQGEEKNPTPHFYRIRSIRMMSSVLTSILSLSSASTDKIQLHRCMMPPVAGACQWVTILSSPLLLISLPSSYSFMAVSKNGGSSESELKLEKNRVSQMAVIER